MASIQTGIELNDQFTGIIYNIIGAVNQSVSAFETMQRTMETPVDIGAASSVRQQLAQAEVATRNLQDTLAQTVRPIDENTQHQQEFNDKIRKGTEDADGLMKTIKNAIAAYATIQTVKSVISVSDELVSTRARIDNMNDGLRTTDEVMNMVYAAAQDARGSFSDMAGVVARFGNNARDAFGSTQEVVAFANLIQKQMTIAGASTQEAANAELQLSQALGSGVLRGDELNSIFEQAPNLIQNIADYLDVPIGKIRDMAADGELSAGVVKAAIFAAADDINAKFDTMPMTWGQIWQSMENTAIMAFQPVLNKLNELGNSQQFQTITTNVIQGMAVTAGIVLNIFELVGQVGAFMYDNWSVLEPLVMGVAVALALYAGYLAATETAELASAAAKTVLILAEYAHAAATGTAVAATTAETAAQMGLNTALLACPVTWIVLAIVAFVAVLMAASQGIANLTGVAQTGFGVISGVVAVAMGFIGNLVIATINQVIIWFVNGYNMIANFAAAFGVLFDDPVAAIKATILSMFNFIVTVVRSAASILDTVFGTGLESAVAGFQDKIQTQINTTVEGAGGKAANTLDPADYTLNRVNYGDTFNMGAAFGDKVAASVSDGIGNLIGNIATDVPNVDDYVSGFSDAIANSGIPGAVDGTEKNTRSLNDTEEDLKYLRDIAEQEAINRFTTAEIKLEMTNNNHISSDLDLDGVISYMTDAAEEAIETMAEGVHE